MPAYAPAQGHLAEVEAELGEIDSAIARLHSLAASSDDPDYAAQLARILGDAGHEAKPGTGAGWPRRAMTNWSRVTRRPSPTMQPNSGLLRVPIRTRHCGSRK